MMTVTPFVVTVIKKSYLGFECEQDIY